jgi:hypothetical protein
VIIVDTFDPDVPPRVIRDPDEPDAYTPEQYAEAEAVVAAYFADHPTITASAVGAEFANPWHDERGRFAPKGAAGARFVATLDRNAPSTGAAQIDPDDRMDLAAAYDEWVYYKGCTEIRYAAETLLDREHAPTILDHKTDVMTAIDAATATGGNDAAEFNLGASARVNAAHDLLGAVHDAPPHEGPLFRGIQADPSTAEGRALLGLKPGDTMDLSLAATSPDWIAASDFATAEGFEPVFVRIRPGAKAIGAPPGYEIEFEKQRGEWVQEPFEFITRVIEIAQVGVFAVPPVPEALAAAAAADVPYERPIFWMLFNGPVQPPSSTMPTEEDDDVAKWKVIADGFTPGQPTTVDVDRVAALLEAADDEADAVTASAAEFANPWHDEVGRFAPKGAAHPVAPLDFTDAQWDFLRPKQYIATTQAKHVAEFASSPDARMLHDTVAGFQEGSNSMTRLRTSMADHLNGEPVNPTTARRLDVLRGAIAQYPGETPPVLYRGLRGQGLTPDQIMSIYQPGKAIPLNVSSFTTDRKGVAGYAFAPAGPKRGAYKGTPIILEVSGGKALPIQNFSRSHMFWSEREWMTGGKFRIDSTEKRTLRGPKGETLEAVIVKVTQEALL